MCNGMTIMILIFIVDEANQRHLAMHNKVDRLAVHQLRLASCTAGMRFGDCLSEFHDDRHAILTGVCVSCKLSSLTKITCMRCRIATAIKINFYS